MNSETTSPIIWIISTGTEILQGHYPDRNAQWLSDRLLSMGLRVARHMAVADDAGSLREAFGEAAARADLLITTGGLGPTVDDLNRQILTELWGCELIEDAEALRRIVERFKQHGLKMPESNRVQALIPSGATILQNDHGTAPGFYMRPGVEGGPRATLLALPGPPREMQPMFLDRSAGLILEQFATCRRRLRMLTFHTIGLSESLINERVRDLFDADPLVNFALLASLGKVDVRLTLMGADEAINAELEAQWRERIHDRLGAENIYGENEETLESVVGDLLRRSGQTLATAESCTGGMVATRLTDVPGSSDIFREGFVTYANEAKMARLGVPEDLLARHGAVSEPVAGAMAQGARRAAGVDWAVSLTGIAGPGGGTEEKPVGLVWFGLASPDGMVRTFERRFIGTRTDVRQRATQFALDLLRRALIDQ